MKVLLVVLLLQRLYWVVPLDSLAMGHPKHTHVAVTGVVAPHFPVVEADGDVHIRLLSLNGTGRFIVAECIPKLPCAKPHAGDTITVQGISRPDPEHNWWEVHPVEEWFMPSKSPAQKRLMGKKTR